MTEAEWAELCRKLREMCVLQECWPNSVAESIIEITRLRAALDAREVHIAKLEQGYESYKSSGERMAKGLVARDEALKVAEEAIALIRPFLRHREDSAEVCYDWCPMCRADSALAALAAAKEGK